ncbi:MAG: M48 family metalloprotease, partial [Rhodopirellula sp.]|nr:M48 family metalloprotease [Rhodopirellula sp.]
MLYDRDFPELPQLIELLGGDEEDRHQAEALCREILTQRESVDVETILAAILSDQGHADEAVSMLTAVCERHPAYWQALYVRGRIRVKTGDIEAGLADSEAASQMMLSVMSEEWIEVFPFGDLDLDFFAEGVDLSHEPGILAGLVAFFIVVCFVLCIRWGLRQKREANGTWRRLLAVAAFVTSLWSIPVIAAAAMIRFEVGNPPGLFWWVFIGFFMFFVIRGTMRPPNLTYVGEDALPECDSPEMLARIDRLAKRIGVATPTVRTQRAMHHAGDSSAAFVGGLAPHSIVLYDTILSQLREDEQDGVIGHELGHIANRSIWIYVAVYPLMMVTVVVLSFLSGGAFGIVAGSAVRAGSFRLISRWFEYDCDRRAALAASPDAVARGLRRIHARHVLGKSGLLTAIVHSTATHPSLDERIHALAKMAGGDATDANQTVSVPYDAGRVALCRKLVVLFAALWLCLTSYGIAAILINGESLSPMLALSAAVFGPTFFMVLAIRKPIRIEAVRHKGKFKWTSLTFRRKVGVVSCAGVFVMAMY